MAFLLKLLALQSSNELNWRRFQCSHCQLNGQQSNEFSFCALARCVNCTMHINLNAINNRCVDFVSGIDLIQHMHNNVTEEENKTIFKWQIQFHGHFVTYTRRRLACILTYCPIFPKKLHVRMWSITFDALNMDWDFQKKESNEYEIALKANRIKTEPTKMRIKKRLWLKSKRLTIKLRHMIWIN